MRRGTFLQVSVNHGHLITTVHALGTGRVEDLRFVVNSAQCTGMFPDARKHFSLDVLPRNGMLYIDTHM